MKTNISTKEMVKKCSKEKWWEKGGNCIRYIFYGYYILWALLLLACMVAQTMSERGENEIEWENIKSKRRYEMGKNKKRVLVLILFSTLEMAVLRVSEKWEW